MCTIFYQYLHYTKHCNIVCTDPIMYEYSLSVIKQSETMFVIHRLNNERHRLKFRKANIILGKNKAFIVMSTPDSTVRI